MPADAGHAQAAMVTEVYSHIATEDRKRLAIGIDPFFAGIHQEENVPEVLDSNTTKLLSMISSDPEKAEKLVKLMELLG